MIEVLRFEEIGSTNDYCRNLILWAGRNSSELLDIAVMADIQSAGRGRMNTRSWVSAVGNFHGSFIINLEKIGMDQSKAPLIAGLSIKSIISLLSNLASTSSFSFKLPNDILVDGRKICGVLAEVIYPFVIIGVGLNLVSSPIETATDLLSEFNIVVKPEDLVQDLYMALVDTLRNA
jgi:BirA family biotin operon repressor/biotin-[acetyl-CoA-carboxylase] ligase